MRDKSKKLTVINTSEKRTSEKGHVAERSVSTFYRGGQPDLSDFLLKSVWDSVFEIKKTKVGDDFIFIKLPVATQYDITMYADGSTLDLPSIYAGLPIDDNTLFWENGVLKSAGGGGGTSDSVAWKNVTDKPEWLIDGKIQYDEIEGIPNSDSFITSEYLVEVLKNYVTLADDETITGFKDFTKGIGIDGLGLSKMEDGVVYLDAHLVVRGGVTMYADTGDLNIPSIYDGLPIDGSTLYWENGVLKAKGGTEGAITSITSEMVTDALGYTPAKTSDIPSLSGYATETYVSERINNLINGAPAAYDTLKEIADVLSGNVDSIGDIITTLGTKADKATTLAGYGITDAYTRTEADNLYSKYLPLTGGTMLVDTIDGFAVKRNHSSNASVIRFANKSGLLGYLGIQANNAIYITSSGVNNTLLHAGNYTSYTYSKSDIDTKLSSYVTLATTQTITGEKDFTGGLKVNGSPIVYDATNKYWKLEGDLLVTGGVTMFGSDSEFTPSTIMDGVVVDNVTIKKNSNGALYFAGSVDGGVASSVAWENVTDKPTFATVATSGKYSDLTGLPDLTVYAKATDLSSYQTKITSTNKLAYSLISGTPTKLSDFTDDIVAGNYLPLTGGTLNSGRNTPLRLAGTDDGSWIAFDNQNGSHNGSIGVYDNNVPYFYHASVNGGNRAKIYHSANLTKLSQLTDDVVSGKYVPISTYTASDILAKLKTVDGEGSGLDADSLDGLQPSELSVLSASKLTTARTIWGQSFDGSGDISGNLTLGYANIINAYGSVLESTSSNVILGKGNARAGFPTYVDGYNVYLRYGKTNNIGLVVNSSGNVLIGTTTDDGYKLRVNGAARIDNYLYLASDINLVGARTSTINMSANGGALSFNIGGMDFSYSKMFFTNSGNLLIGTTTDSGYKLDVNGSTRINGIPIYKSQDDVLYIDGNLAVRGGITMYATDAINVDDIIKNLPIASTSAKGIAAFNASDFSVVDGYVSFIGSGGVDESVLASYAKKTDLNSYLPLSGGLVSGIIGYNLDVGGYAVSVPAAGVLDYWTSMTANGQLNTKKTFIGSALNNDTQQWWNLISVRHRNGGGDGTNFGMYISSSLNDASDKTLCWNRQYNGNWEGERVILDSWNWSNYVSVTGSQSFSGTVMINGSNALESYPALKFHIANINWSQFLMGGDGKIHLVSGSAQNSDYRDLYVGNMVANNLVIRNQAVNSVLGLSLYMSEDFVTKYGILFTGTSTFGGQFGDVLTGDWATYFTMDGGSYTQGTGVRGWIFRHASGGNVASIGADGNIQSTAWYRTIGNGGWYNETWGGGLYMTDNYWVRIYGGKAFYCESEILAGGGITMYSDIRKKTKLQDVELSLKQIAEAPLIEHYYNSDDKRTTHVGSIAQYWAGMNDWFCKLDGEGYYTMEIQNAALASAISIARELVKYESKTDKKIRLLKQRISELEDKIEMLEKKGE